MNRHRPLPVRFYRTTMGHEPVGTWLRRLDREAKRIIGTDIKTVQYRWPLGMPLVRKLQNDLWEVRSTLPDSIARVVFTVYGGTILLLHGFMKKSRKTSASDLHLARTRLKTLREVK